MRKAEHWVCMGELEESVPRGTCFETTHDEWYLFKYKKKVNNCWLWSIAPSADVAFAFDQFMTDIDISPLTFLVYFISQDRIFGRCDGGSIGRKCSGFKIRFVGMTEWLEVDDDFYNCRINLLELENKFRKHKLIPKIVGNNQKS